jgi:transforming growth factor-beta-induced protein
MLKIVSLFLSAAAVAASGGHVSASSSLTEDILDVLATDTSNFQTLHAAVELAGLAETLKSDGPFTFFAPNQHAFELLGEETLQQLFANPDELREMLLYHMLPGHIMAKDDIKEGAMETAQGGSIHVTVTDHNPVLNDDTDIISFDIVATNGVIHVIDRLLLPSFVPSISESRELASLPTIAGLASSNTGLKTLTTALKATGLDKTLASAGPFTVFAPTDKVK